MKKILDLLKSTFKKHFFTGLLVVLPIWLTLILLYYLIAYMDKLFNILPKSLHPDNLIGFHIPGLGLILVVVIIVATGVAARNYFGQKMIKLGDRILFKIPVGRTIYSTLKQFFETVLMKSSVSFRKVVLIEFPRKGIYSIAFVTGPVEPRCNEASGEKLVNLFYPTTPNPTTGFFMMIPEKDVIELPLTVEEAFKLIISAGIVSKTTNNNLPQTIKKDG